MHLSSCEALVKLELHSAVASCNSYGYASLGLSNHLRASVARQTHPNHVTFVNDWNHLLHLNVFHGNTANNAFL